MLNPSYTLVVGTAPNEKTFVFADQNRLDGQAVQYYAASGTGDLAGRSTFKVSHETTKAKVVRSLSSFVIPYTFPDGTRKYVKSDHIVSRPDDIPVAFVEEAMELIQEILATTGYKSAVAQASL